MRVRWLDLIPPAFRRVDSQANAEQRQRLVHDEVRGNEDPALDEPLIAKVGGGLVQRIGRIGEHHPSRRVHEGRLHESSIS
ncbi:MAG: hypothetical protein IT293_11250 [Deltaproteobacteria bacterium]|nr:hypothetical protein [Deltaproteobacteria bacterium]